MPQTGSLEFYFRYPPPPAKDTRAYKLEQLALELEMIAWRLPKCSSTKKRLRKVADKIRELK